jgi:hypothetical protein
MDEEYVQQEAPAAEDSHGQNMEGEGTEATKADIKDFSTGNLSKSLLILGAIGMLMYVLLSGASAVAGDSWEGTFFNARASYGIFNLFIILFIFGVVMHFISLQFKKLEQIADELDEALYVPDEDWDSEEALTEEELVEEEVELKDGDEAPLKKSASSD